jgi:hypothetical protein
MEGLLLRVVSINGVWKTVPKPQSESALSDENITECLSQEWRDAGRMETSRGWGL